MKDVNREDITTSTQGSSLAGCYTLVLTVDSREVDRIIVRDGDPDEEQYIRAAIDAAPEALVEGDED